MKQPGAKPLARAASARLTIGELSLLPDWRTDPPPRGGTGNGKGIKEIWASPLAANLGRDLPASNPCGHPRFGCGGNAAAAESCRILPTDSEHRSLANLCSPLES